MFERRGRGMLTYGIIVGSECAGDRPKSASGRLLWSVAAVGRDVSERRRREDAIRKSERDVSGEIPNVGKFRFSRVNELLNERKKREIVRGEMEGVGRLVVEVGSVKILRTGVAERK